MEATPVPCHFLPSLSRFTTCTQRNERPDLRSILLSNPTNTQTRHATLQYLLPISLRSSFIAKNPISSSLATASSTTRSLRTDTLLAHSACNTLHLQTHHTTNPLQWRPKPHKQRRSGARAKTLRPA